MDAINLAKGIWMNSRGGFVGDNQRDRWVVVKWLREDRTSLWTPRSEPNEYEDIVAYPNQVCHFELLDAVGLILSGLGVEYSVSYGWKNDTIETWIVASARGLGDWDLTGEIGL